jgi:erythromycin esterase
MAASDANRLVDHRRAHTHGTREVFQMKDRMLEFLVREMGFTVFALEASMPDCIPINDYVLHGRGDPQLAVAGQGFWTWNTADASQRLAWHEAANEIEQAPAEQEPRAGDDDAALALARQRAGNVMRLLQVFHDHHNGLGRGVLEDTRDRYYGGERGVAG